MRKQLQLSERLLFLDQVYKSFSEHTKMIRIIQQ